MFFKRRERDINDEIQAHLNMAAQDRMEAGERASDAAAYAHRDFGNVTLTFENTRRVWIAHWFEVLAQDLQYAMRTFRRSPGFATIALMSLALGIGVNTAIFSLLDRTILRPLPVAHPEQLYILQTRQADTVTYRFSYPAFMRVREALPGGAAAAMTRAVRYQMTSDGGSESVVSQLVSNNWFAMLGIQPALGTVISDPRTGITSVISYGFWQRRFGGDRNVIGKRIAVNGAPVTIVGVAPEHFFGTTVGAAPELWLPAAAQVELRHFSDADANDADIRKPWIPQDGVSWLNLMIRVPDGSQFTAVRGRLHSLFQRRLEEAAAKATDPADREQISKIRFEIVPGSRGFDDLRRFLSAMLYVLMATAGLVLLVACANIANLLLARGSARQKEIAVRQALGASRFRIVRQLVTESLILAITGAAAGVTFASFSAPALLRMLSAGSPVTIPIELAIDYRVLAFAAALAIATTLLFGLAPAFRLSKPQLAAAMSTGLRSVAGRQGAARLRKLLVSAQVALSLALLVGAGLFARSLQNLTRVDAGYEREQLLTVRMDPRAGGYSEEQLPAFYQRLLAAIRGVPGVRDASLSLYSLASGSARTSGIFIAGRATRPGEQLLAQENFVGQDYFATVGIPIVAGRAFTAADDQKAQKVAVINQTMANRRFGSENPIGRRFGYDRAPKDNTYEIVGVIRDARVNNLREPVPNMIYYSLAQHPHEYMRSIDVRSSLPLPAAVPALRKAIASVDATLPVREIITVGEQVERTLSTDRTVAQLTAAFSVLGLALACIGLYGVLSYAIRQRTTEIGVRIALGASRADILRMVLREALVIVCAGAAVGIAIALGAGRVLTTMLFGLTPADPLTLATTTLILVAVAMLAAFLPARRAAASDPITALRCE